MTSEPEPRDQAAAPTVSRWRKLGVGMLTLAVLALLFRVPLLRAVTLPLVVDDGPREADVIVVLGGGDGQRVAYGVELWERGLSRSGKLLMAGGRLYADLTWASVMADEAARRGVPREAILLQSLSDTTRTDAEASLEMMRAQGFTSALIVTDAWHSRRARRAFRKIAPEGWSFHCASLPPPEDDWWRDDVQARYVVTELLKWIWSR